ncbi:hypothetical protein FRC02_000277 [Tulasnella sp. 418]|nr:hypothetical protein FRC02_000277 [Tulasnella sp. 418]
MRSFLLFLLPLTTVAFAIPLETTGYHLNPRAECPPFNRVQIDGGPSERVTLITEDIFSSSFRPSFWNGPKKGCRYETIQRKTVDDKTIRIDIIQPYKGGSFTAKQMDDIKKNYWVLSTFKDGGSTWVKILSGKWKPWAELELARELAQSSSIEGEHFSLLKYSYDSIIDTELLLLKTAKGVMPQ